jgi:hypothetical protein
VAVKPVADLSLHETDTGLNTDVGDEIALGVLVDRLGINLQQRFEVFGGQQAQGRG